ncbi:MAG: hypothetical protein KC620_04510 [Myxococcales bacterium]|nr:hypothetical protein [Myxococcales bacterium]
MTDASGKGAYGRQGEGRLARLLLLAALAGLAVSCSSAVGFSTVTGTCSAERDTCMSRCDRLVDGRDCEMACDFEGRQCERAQSGGAGLRADRPKISDYQVMLVDLFGPTPRASDTAVVELGGSVESKGGAHHFAPGATIKIEYTLPPHIREAELALTHGPGGDGTGCYITMTFGPNTLAGRYAPPRSADDSLRVETWNLTEQIAGKDEAQKVTLFIYNNASAGSKTPYRLAGVQLFYRTLAPSADTVE